ncbi:MAG: tryptophan 7-halogenase [Nitrosomonas sp.]|nr:tryptophan 7-halogenase [Nitrosomonas sp.]
MEKIIPESLLTPGTTATQCDVLVVGGGPAGSTCATLLAEKGFQVIMIEKEQHPRFHIGESLLPANMPLLEQLGVAEAIKNIGLLKLGIEFNSPKHDHVSLIEFSDGWNKDFSWAYQVRRSEFDEILFRNAAKKGVHTIENCRVRDIQFDDNGDSPVIIRAVTETGQTCFFEAKFLVDASGRDTFLANKYKTKQKDRKHSSSAIFGHFHDATRLQGEKEGYISIFWFEHGWFWFIPLADGTTSVGAVCWPYYLNSRKKPLEEFLWDTIRLSPQLADRMKHAKLVSEAYATGNYSYASSVSHGKQFIMVGDAYAFVDPVFSSGVMLAMNSAFKGADVIEAVLNQSHDAPAKFKEFNHVIQHGPKEFSWFIHRVTNPFIQNLFMYPRKFLGTKASVLSVLSGDIFNNPKIWPSVYIFKAVYYLSSLFSFKRAWEAKKRRAYNIRDVDNTV